MEKKNEIKVLLIDNLGFEKNIMIKEFVNKICIPCFDSEDNNHIFKQIFFIYHHEDEKGTFVFYQENLNQKIIQKKMERKSIKETIEIIDLLDRLIKEK